MITNLKSILVQEWLRQSLVGALGAAFILAIYQSFNVAQPRFATIHITQMMDEFVKSEANKKMGKEELSREVKNYAKTLEHALDDFAKKNNLILIPREAVIAGVPDETEQFLHVLQKNK